MPTRTIFYSAQNCLFILSPENVICTVWMRNVEPRILIIDIAISFSSYEFSANLMKSRDS